MIRFEDAKLLAKFAKNTPCKINLIEYNHVDNLPYSKSSSNMTNSFISYLEKQYNCDSKEKQRKRHCCCLWSIS